MNFVCVELVMTDRKGWGFNNIMPMAARKAPKAGWGFNSIIPISSLKRFKYGGPVPKTGPVMAHKGEFVLPKGVRPNTKQREQIKAIKRRARK